MGWLEWGWVGKSRLGKAGWERRRLGKAGWGKQVGKGRLGKEREREREAMNYRYMDGCGGVSLVRKFRPRKN